MIVFDITSIYSDIFGYKGLPFGSKELFSEKERIRKEDEFSDITPLAKGNRQVKAFPGSMFYMPTALDGKMLPNEPLVSYSIQKHIVVTPLAGNTRRGSVKEIINTEDYKITISGVCIVADSDEYPTEQVEMLKTIFEKNQSITIKNDLTRLLEIDRVVIESLKLPEMKGIENAQAYEITCLSDTDFSLIVD